MYRVTSIHPILNEVQ